MKFSIVTPAYNSEAYIRDTIESVLSQKGDFEIEYIIMDGGSADGTVRIAKEYESVIVISEKDRGMYDAVNKGFARATGDILAWINADDTYLPGAFQAIALSFSAFPEIRWLKGKTVFTDELGNRTSASPCHIFNREWIRKGIYGRNAYFITQDSVFWRKSLWEAAGPIDAELRLAGDYDLWIKFAERVELWSLDCEVSTFRTRKGQLSENENAYRKEQYRILPPRGFICQAARMFFWAKAKLGPSRESFFLKLYPMLFWKRQKRYLALENGRPVINKISSYRPS